MSGKSPGDKGPMGADAHDDKRAADKPDAAAERKDGELQENLEESFPGSDAPTDTRRTKSDR